MSTPDIPHALRQRVREAAHDRCGYCLSSQHYVMAKLEIEHIIPCALGRTEEESNLWLSCGLCNRYKGTQTTGIDPLDQGQVALFNPRTSMERTFPLEF